MNIGKGNAFWTKNFIFIMLSNALLFMAFEMLVPTLPLLAESIGCTPSQIGLAVGIFTFSAMVARPFCGAFANIMDKKYILFIGVLISMLSTGSYMFSTCLIILLVFRLIHGFGFGIASTFYVTLASEQLPVNRMGEGMGYFGVGETICMSVGPMIGIAILNHFNFKGLFTFGTVVLLIAVLFVLGITSDNMRKNNSLKNNAKKRSPKLIEQRVLFQSVLILLLGVVYSGVMAYLSLFAKQQGIANVAWFFFVSAITGILIRVGSGKIFDKRGPTYVLIPSGMLLMIGMILIAYSQTDLQLNIAGVFYGVAFGAIFPSIQAWVLSTIEIEERENAMSFLNCFDIEVGGGAMLLGIIVQATSYKAMYLLSILFIILFLVLTVYFDRDKRRKSNSSLIFNIKDSSSTNPIT